MNAVISKLDKQKHKFILMSILLDISNSDILKKTIVFKWWTSLYLLYGLDRFSTDLDFDFIEWINSKDQVLEEIWNILKKYWDLKDLFVKRNTIFWLLSYWDIDHNIKFEVSTRWVSWKYSLKNFIWIQLFVLDLEYITSNKFIALTTRDKLANRDIYDIYFILKNNLSINKEHIEKITWKTFKDYITFMISFLQKLPKNYNILDWLWVTIDEKQKSFVKERLIIETIFLLNIYL
jgi:predicted nucleotidyltransferase component of viral defense system